MWRQHCLHQTGSPFVSTDSWVLSMWWLSSSNVYTTNQPLPLKQRLLLGVICLVPLCRKCTKKVGISASIKVLSKLWLWVSNDHANGASGQAVGSQTAAGRLAGLSPPRRRPFGENSSNNCEDVGHLPSRPITTKSHVKPVNLHLPFLILVSPLWISCK